MNGALLHNSGHLDGRSSFSHFKFHSRCLYTDMSHTTVTPDLFDVLVCEKICLSCWAMVLEPYLEPILGSNRLQYLVSLWPACFLCVV